MNIEARLTELVGEAGKRLHTGRSRNDQVVTDVRLYLRDAIDDIDGQLAKLLQAILVSCYSKRQKPLCLGLLICKLRK